jgi:hypothetical protein
LSNGQLANSRQNGWLQASASLPMVGKLADFLYISQLADRRQAGWSLYVSQLADRRQAG